MEVKQLNKHYFTFGTYPECVQVVHAETPDIARNRMFAGWGDQWSMQYDQQEWTKSINEGYFKNARFLPEIYTKK